MVTSMIRNLTLLISLCLVSETSWLQAQSDSNRKPRWLVVTTAELAGELEPLIVRRQQQGLEVVKVFRDAQSTGTAWNSEFIRNKIFEMSREPSRPTYVLLVGDWNEGSEQTYVPTGKGKRGRMQNASTDHGYGWPNDQGEPTVAVGRFPAHTAEQVKQFVAKVIRFEDQKIGPWTNRMNLWVGHPGGNSVLEKRLGETIVQSAVKKSLSRLHLAWSGSCLIDFPNTPYSVDRKTFRERMQSDLAHGECFTIYAGHSAAEGIWSEDQMVFHREDWERIKIESSPGVVLTTGCFSCQMTGHNGHGFLTSSILNPHGSVAGIGAYAESYAAHGQLAMDAFVDLVAHSKPPTRLGDYWLSIAHGIGSGKMDPLTYWLYDQADGSRGAVPFEQQRLEHLEMWTLLGDPALKIPFLEPSLDLDVVAEIGATEVVVQFDVPPELAGTTCDVQLQFRPKTGTKVLQPTIRSQQLGAGPQQTVTISDFKPLSVGELRVRVFAYKEGHGILGIALVDLD